MRKNICLLFAIVILISELVAQVPPEKMTYQVVVRDNNNELVVNQAVGVKINILASVPNGLSVYEETHLGTTNANGLLSLQVGTGNPTPGSVFSTIDWGNDDFYLKSEIDPLGGNNYTIVGVQQLITVPYSFYAGKSAFADSSDYQHLANRPMGSNPGDLLYWNGTDWSIVSAGVQGQTLVMGNNNIPTWSNVNGTLGNPPMVVTDTIYDITGRTALVRCHIANPGSTGVIASGVCWSTNPYPSLGNSYTTDGTSIDTFVSQINNLISGTTFYARAYATNSIGTSYGNPIKFITPTHCGIVKDYDGNSYNTVYIGAQCWMKENLKTKHYSNGASIYKGSNGSYDSKYYYYYNWADSNEAKYGLLYSWQAVMNGAGSSNNNPSGIQGICPSGWHVPSNTEWCELENYIEPGIDVTCSSTGVRGSMAKKVTAAKYWKKYGSNSFAPGYWLIDPNGFDESGFSALPGGYYYYSSSPYFHYVGEQAWFWTCTAPSTYSAYCRYINYDQSGIGMTTQTKSSDVYGLSVRCVKN